MNELCAYTFIYALRAMCAMKKGYGVGKIEPNLPERDVSYRRGNGKRLPFSFNS